MQNSKPLVLQVNDHEASRRELTWTLQAAGFRVISVGTGTDELATLAEQPDLVLLVGPLSETQGAQLCHLLRERARPRWLPIVQLSPVGARSATGWPGGECWPDVSLWQPGDAGVLIATLDAFLRVSRERGSGTAAAGEGTVPTKSAPGAPAAQTEAFREGRNRILESIATSQPLRTILEAATQLVEQTSPRLHCSIMLLDSERGQLRYEAGSSLPEAYRHAIDGMAIGPQMGSCGRAAYRRETVRVRDIATDPLWQTYRYVALAHGFRACWSLPVQNAQGEVVGTFALYLREPGEITPEEEELVRGLAPLVGIAVAREQETAALRASSFRYQNLLDTASEGVCMLDEESKITYANHQVARLFGYELSEMVGRDFREFLFPEDYAQADEHQVQRVAGYQTRFDFRHRHRDGSEVWCIVSASPILDARGTFGGTLVMLTDVTDRRRAEEERDRFFSASRDLLCIVGIDGYFRRVNPSFTETLGFSEQELLSRPYLEFIHPDDREATVREHVHLAEGTPVLHFMNRCRCADGGYRWIAWTTAPYPKEGLAYAVGRDMTPLKQAEEALEHTRQQLAQSQKMEAVGRLAGGVAHDFNNMLAVINGYSELILGQRDLAPALRDSVMEIKQAGERAAGLTAQLLAFSRKSMLSTDALQMSEVIRGLEGMLRRLIGEDIELSTRLHPGDSTVQANRGQVEQVLINLVVNARDAMPTGGKILITAAPVRLDGEHAEERVPLPPGEYVRISVSDTGCGMDAATLEHIWEPFFSTKGEHGTGLGLSTVYGIVQQYDGAVQAVSDPGEGTTFTVLLPRVGSNPQLEVAEEAELAPPRPSATILVVEDEDLVRGLVRNVLLLEGYTLLEAGSGDHALTVSAEYPGPIDLLLTDVVMPGNTGGRRLAERLLEERPKLKVLYMSGYTDDAVMRYGIEHHETHFIQKPFSPALLLQKVRETLDED